MAKRTMVMVVMDGWGVGEKNETNPIYIKNPKTINFIKHNYLAGVVQASGIAVGLPWNEEGNSEVGHLTLGSGRVLYQHYPRITLSIRNEEFFKNAVLLDAIKTAKERGTNVNIMGVLSEGNVHASMEHIEALIKLAKLEGLPRINFQVFTDGKDGPPKNATKLLRKLISDSGDPEVSPFRMPQGETSTPFVRIGTVSGRYYAMDRDKHWNRTEKAYKAIIGDPVKPAEAGHGASPVKSQSDHGTSSEGAVQYIEGQYEKGLTDEYVEPMVIDPEAVVKDGDSVIFFNFREDSIRQLVEMFMGTTTENDIIVEKKLKDLNIVTFTNYNDNYKLPVAFPPETVTKPLGKVLADSGKTQLRVAETNKYAHVTYFFNGFVETPFENEFRILIPSQNVARHDEHPEMRAEDITTRALEALAEGIYDFVLINYANADIVAHTGNYDATIRAVEAVDNGIAKLMDAVLKSDGVLLITADHGNAEKLLEAETGLPETKHNISPVPIYIVGKDFKREKDDFDVEQGEKESAGLLSDIAPTILEIMGIRQPEEMTGISLLRILQ